jgi:hypothetical protein
MSGVSEKPLRRRKSYEGDHSEAHEDQFGAIGIRRLGSRIGQRLHGGCTPPDLGVLDANPDIRKSLESGLRLYAGRPPGSTASPSDD